MKLQTKIQFKKAQNQIDYKSQLLLLGSCFAESMGEKFNYFKFQSLQNPFGILFHSIAIENLIARAIFKKQYTEKDIFFVNERWHCFDAHSDLSDISKENLLENLNYGLMRTTAQISQATHLLITLGTAWVYRKNSTNKAVANCHKVPQKEFSKELLSADAVQQSLSRSIQTIQSINNKVQILLSVSPVRHLKDGFVENQRSKAHLMTAIHNLIENSNLASTVSYFPSFEIMMDELRDYRFYQQDMLHPNQLAVDYIWEKFKAVWISETCFDSMNAVNEVQKDLAHRAFDSNSEQHQNFLKSVDKKITYLQQKHSFMTFDK